MLMTNENQFLYQIMLFLFSH